MELKPTNLMNSSGPNTSSSSSTILAQSTSTSSARLTPTSKYVRDFESLFVPIRVDQLRDKAQGGNLKHCQFRSICWRYFLNCLPQCYDEWLNYCKTSRKQYEAIRARHLTAVMSPTPSDKASEKQEHQQNPSASQVKRQQLKSDSSSSKLINATRTNTQSKQQQQAGQSPNTKSARSNDGEEERQYKKASDECDHKNVYRTIERDVVRTFPDMEFFRQTQMQTIMGNVLFIFASENPKLSYKQGMHELLGTLLYVAHTDSQNCLINHEGGYANETIATLIDREYLEHDVYLLFSALMKSIETWYQNDEILLIPEAPKNFMKQSFSNGQINRSSVSSSHQVSSVLGLKLKMISENIVKSYDLELFNHLEALQIAPQIYGIRWMRLLFGREFEFLDLLTVWDAIICDKNPMSLVDYVFASMLITIRDTLVNGDYTDCLNNLMRHQFKDSSYVLKLALHLRDPLNYSRPRQHNPVKSTSYSRLLNQRHNSTSLSSLTSKLSRQYINVKQFSQQRANIASSKSNDDLHSIVDYCWRLLSEQIDSLQRCLPKEKSLNSEDEIFVALAQLKKVRDVLKGSLKLEDELESPSAAGGSKI